MNIIYKNILKIILLIYTLLSTTQIYAVLEYDLIIKEHKFYPEILEVPARTKIKLSVYNQDNSVEEFESFDLKREKIIPGNSQIKITLPPLKPGDYSFFGEFNPETAQGILRVLEK
ncbi:MAG: cupredoxin domain-containing protein [Rickettsia sp.]|nr:cupredoxin domain-containing protein [Rickettsia sp.]